MIHRIAKLLRMTVPSVVTPGFLFSSGETTPTDAARGYQAGCIFQNTATGVVYVNTGTYDSCDFDAISASEDTTLASLSDVTGIAYTSGKVLVANGTKYAEVAATTIPVLSATAGTATASKALILGASGELATLTTATITTLTSTTVNSTTVNAGADASAGTVNVFPATTARGKIIISCADNATNHTLTITNTALNGASKIATFPAVTGYVAESTAALTLAQVDVLNGATAGTQVANKAVIADANVNIGVVKATSLYIGASSSEVQVTATPAQLNTLAGAIGGLTTVMSAGLGGSASYLKTDSGTKTLVAANASKGRGALVVVHIDETFANGSTGAQPTMAIGEDDTISKAAATIAFTNAAAGAIFVFGFTNLVTKKIIATLTAATNDATGGATITVISIPNS